ncbi:MAG TPA: GTP-binding protein [Deltaproteobacteria bacterium]|nr:GTP-binding protein [Deltaproteobacteria bacterium]
MAELPVVDVPTTVVTGSLGVGKTTAILDLFGHRPPDGRWAVLINELGEVSIDGPILRDGGLTVEEVQGGCICCSAGVALRAALVQLLRRVRPDRLLIEPTGLAHPAAVIDALRTPGLREAISLRAVIGLVDPRHVRSQRHRDSHPWQDQLRIADVLVANKVDLATDDDLEAFRSLAAEAWPPKLAVAEVSQGQLDPGWLDLAPGSAPVFTRLPDTPRADGRGLVWPPAVAFDRDQLEDLLQRLVRPGELLSDGVLRLKGIFRVRRGWFLIQADADAIRWSPIGHRRDSRVEILVPPGTGTWDRVEDAFTAARLR